MRILKGHQKIENKIPGGISRFALGFCKNKKKRTETLYQSFSPFMTALTRTPSERHGSSSINGTRFGIWEREAITVPNR